MLTYIRSIALVVISFFVFSISAQAACYPSADLALGRADPILASNQGVSPEIIVPLTKVARFYLNTSNKHFWTTNPTELGANWCATSASFTLEGYSYQSGIFNVSSQMFSGGSPVYRFRNSQNGAYFYTISDTERLVVMANLPQYQYEGIAWYAEAAQVGNTKPVYRFYNATNSAHFYTSNEEERQSILKNLPSYVLEGIVFWAW